MGMVGLFSTRAAFPVDDCEGWARSRSGGLGQGRGRHAATFVSLCLLVSVGQQLVVMKKVVFAIMISSLMDGCGGCAGNRATGWGTLLFPRFLISGYLACLL